MITIKNEAEIAKMRKAGELLHNVLEALREEIDVGVTTLHINKLAERLIRSAGAEPSFLGYNGFPYYKFSPRGHGPFRLGGVIIPLKGNGLWGPIWGYIALADDSFSTVVGAVFDHQGETPGLGAEIATDNFAKRFIGKRMELRPIKLTKNADKDSPYQVDAISGGTMTSNGVSDMLEKAWEDYEFLQQYMI